MKPAPGAASKRAMSIHKVNIDAIAAGAGAFLLDWPNEPRQPTIPGRAHRVLWADDYWRGVDMARVVVVDAVSGWKRERAPSHVFCRSHDDGVSPGGSFASGKR